MARLKNQQLYFVIFLQKPHRSEADVMGCDDTTRNSQFHCIITALKNQQSGYFYTHF